MRRLAANYLRRERPGQTLQATALVHEASLRLSKEMNQPWKNRTHFLAIAALAIVIVGGNVRLHLWFTARTYRSELAPQLANIGRLVRAADVAFSLLMMGIGLVLADAHTGWAALFVSFGLGGALTFLVIEPATARAAFGTTSEISNLRSQI